MAFSNLKDEAFFFYKSTLNFWESFLNKLKPDEKQQQEMDMNRLILGCSSM